jgi:hypothetical protein
MYIYRLTNTESGAVLEGTAVFQWQIYVPLEDGYITLTITSCDQDILTDLLKCFSAL